METIHQLDAASRTLNGVDRHARFAECLDVAQDGSLGDFECAGKFHGRRPPAALQHQQHVEHPCRAHRKSLEET